MYELTDELDDDEFHREIDKFLEELTKALADDVIGSPPTNP